MGFDAERRQQRFSRLFEEQILAVVADLDQRDIGEAGFPVRPDGIDDRIQVGPAGNGVRDVVGPHELVAPANPAGVGRSALTFQPPPNHRNWSCARSTAASRSGSQQIGICPTTRPRHRAVPLPGVRHATPSHELRVRFHRDQVVGECRELLDRFATHRHPMPTGMSGTSQSRAESTWK